MATMSRAQALSKHGVLYGPDRDKQAEEIRKVLQKSSVLQDGEYNFTNNKLKGDVWMTTVSRDFMSTLPDLRYRSQVRKIDQLDHHFGLDHDKETIPHNTYKQSSTKDDFDKKSAEKVKMLESDRVVNWPDMAPQFRRNVQTGNTEYGTSIGIMNTGLSGPEFPRLNASKVTLPLDSKSQGLQKKTNFQFGSDENGFLSESRRAYGRDTSASRRAGLDILAGDASDALEQSKQMKTDGTASHVFRPGDYNGIAGDFISTNTICYGPGTKAVRLDEVKKTVRFRDTFLNNNHDSIGRREDSASNQLIEYARQNTVPKVFADAKDERWYQEQAHFQFGTDFEKKATVYNKDFPSGWLDLRRPHCTAPHSANNVIQFDPEHGPTGTTSAKVDFTYHPAPPIKMSTFAESNDFNDSVVLSHDLNRYAADRQTSLAYDTYEAPPSTFKAMAPRRDPWSQWDYIQTEAALPYKASDTDNSESTDNFFDAFMMGSSARERRYDCKKQCKERVAKGMSSHFSIGQGDSQKALSETKLNFTRLPKNNDSIPSGVKI